MMALLIAQATSVTLDMNTIILAVIGLIGTTVTGYLALRMAALAQDAKESKENMKEIHIAVNSAKTALETKLEDFTKQNVELSKKLATMEEAQRGADLAKALATVPSIVAVPVAAVAPVVQVAPSPVVVSPAIAPAPAAKAPTPAPAPTSTSPEAKLDSAISDLHVAATEASAAAQTVVVATEKTEELAVKFTKP